VDSLAEDFLRSTGRASDDDDDEDELASLKFLGPSVLALVGPDGLLRNALKTRLEAQVCVCERERGRGKGGKGGGSTSATLSARYVRDRERA
jgi:hypothetical protein